MFVWVQTFSSTHHELHLTMAGGWGGWDGRGGEAGSDDENAEDLELQQVFALQFCGLAAFRAPQRRLFSALRQDCTTARPAAPCAALRLGARACGWVSSAPPPAAFWLHPRRR